jgi:hypothetical protein
LKDPRELAILAEARALVQALPKHRQQSEDWLYATALMRDAVNGLSVAREMEARLKRALTAEGLLEPAVQFADHLGHSAA